MTFVHEVANGTKHVHGKQAYDTLRVAAAPFMFDICTLASVRVHGTGRSVMPKARFP
jgi:hypothetical protein